MRVSARSSQTDILCELCIFIFHSPPTCTTIGAMVSFILSHKKMICASELRRLNMDAHVPSHSFSPPRVASLVNEPLLDRLKMEKKNKISGRDNIFFFWG